MTTRRLLLASLLAAVPCAGVAGADPAPAAPAPKVAAMTVAEVHDALAKKGAAYVYDANEREAYDEAHVPGARWIDNQGLDKVTAASFPADKGAELVFYCANEH